MPITFVRYSKYHIDDLGWPDISFGMHLCMRGRIDIHFLKWIISLGKVPIYTNGRSEFASSNSYDERVKIRSNKPIPLRVGSYP